MATKVTLSSRRRCQAAIPGSRRELIFHQPGTRWAAVRRGESIGSALQREPEVVPPQGLCVARLALAAVTPQQRGQPLAQMGVARPGGAEAGQGTVSAATNLPRPPPPVAIRQAPELRACRPLGVCAGRGWLGRVEY